MNTRLGLGGVGALALVLSLLITGVGITVAPPSSNASVITEQPAVAQASNVWSWRAYTIKYRYATNFAVRMSEAVRRRIGGPVQYYNVYNARYKERIKARRSTTWECPQFGPGWRCYWLNLKHDGPGFLPWGMEGIVQLRWRNGVIKEVAGTKDCWSHSLFVTVEEKLCDVVIDTAGVDTATFKIKYKASWSYLFGNTTATSGGSWSAKGDGWLGAPRYYP